MQKNRNKERVEKVVKPFLRGRMIDRTLPGGALKFFFFMMLMVFVYFMSIIVSSVESRFLTVVINVAIVLTTWMIFWQSGMASGADAVRPWHSSLAVGSSALSSLMLTPTADLASQRSRAAKASAIALILSRSASREDSSFSDIFMPESFEMVFKSFEFITIQASFNRNTQTQWFKISIDRYGIIKSHIPCIL